MTGERVVVEHMRLLTNRRQRRELQFQLRRLARKGKQGGLSLLSVVHEDDGSCCRREEWRMTARRLLGSLAADGVRAARLSPSGLMVGNPRAEEEAQQLRERLEKAAGGALPTLGPTAVAVRDRILERWYLAGAPSCEHAVKSGTQMYLMAHAAELARCVVCCCQYAIAHTGEEEERTCDYCRRPTGGLSPVVGPWYGTVLVSSACPSCYERIKQEAAA